MKTPVLALVLLAAPVLAQERREPIRVGSNVQESKLIHKVDIVFPEAARTARVSGIVILQITVGVEGNVLEAQVLRGHPLDRKSTRLNSSHLGISYAVFC